MRPLSSNNSRVASKLCVRPGVNGTFSVWMQYCCLATFASYQEAAGYVKKACCFNQEDLCQLELFPC